jgi:hypothetical protein
LTATQTKKASDPRVAQIALAMVQQEPFLSAWKGPLPTFDRYAGAFVCQEGDGSRMEAIIRAAEGQVAFERVCDFNRAHECTPEVAAAIETVFQYAPWTPEKIEAGGKVRQALAEAVKVIVANVPPCPTRTVAIRKIIEARMDCNAAITHDGRF